MALDEEAVLLGFLALNVGGPVWGLWYLWKMNRTVGLVYVGLLALVLGAYGSWIGPLFKTRVPFFAPDGGLSLGAALLVLVPCVLWGTPIPILAFWAVKSRKRDGEASPPVT